MSDVPKEELASEEEASVVEGGEEDVNQEVEGEEEIVITAEDIKKMSERVLNLQEESVRMEQMMQEMQTQTPTNALRKDASLLPPHTLNGL